MLNVEPRRAVRGSRDRDVPAPGRATVFTHLGFTRSGGRSACGATGLPGVLRGFLIPSDCTMEVEMDRVSLGRFGDLRLVKEGRSCMPASSKRVVTGSASEGSGAIGPRDPADAAVAKLGRDVGRDRGHRSGTHGATLRGTPCSGHPGHDGDATIYNVLKVQPPPEPRGC